MLYNGGEALHLNRGLRGAAEERHVGQPERP